MNYIDRDTYGMYKGSNTLHLSGVGEHQGPGPQLMGADTLNGNDVYNLKDEKLGEIKEIMLDVPSGQVSYAVLSCGGFMGLGEKLFAVPWNALSLDTKNKRFVLKADKGRLELAPGFDKNHWPDMADPSWVQDIHAYYGTQPLSSGPQH